MAANKNAQKDKPSTAEAQDGPLLDTLGAKVKKMVQKGKERGFVTYDELNAALPPEQVSSEQIEDTMTSLSEMGINVIEADDADDQPAEASTDTPAEGEAT
ncbi:MAG: RNA polymerase sigma factor RpoD, partial [Sphingomonadales bacterium]|nr:RNA polymerase sigma factor RpoD [Sphingomonadales bacterium]